MFEFTSSSIQLGFDIATSVTIIGAAASWWWESKRRAKIEKKQGMIDQVRSTSLEKILCIVEEFENAFSSVAQSSLKVLSGINTFGDHNEYANHVIESVKNGQVSLEEKIKYSIEYRNRIDKYYETIQKRRYTLLPILESLDPNNKFFNSIREEINELFDQFADLNEIDLPLLSNLHELSEYIISQIKQDSGPGQSGPSLNLDKEMYLKSAQIILNEDNVDFVSKYLSKEQSLIYKQSMESGTELTNEQRNSIISEFISWIVEDPKTMQGHALLNLTISITHSRRHSKSLLIKLSALTNKLLSNQDDLDLELITKKFESDDYFAIDSRVR
jgi:hypothetical protein